MAKVVWTQEDIERNKEEDEEGDKSYKPYPLTDADAAKLQESGYAVKPEKKVERGQTINVSIPYRPRKGRRPCLDIRTPLVNRLRKSLPEECPITLEHASIHLGSALKAKIFGNEDQMLHDADVAARILAVISWEI